MQMLCLQERTYNEFLVTVQYLIVEAEYNSCFEQVFNNMKETDPKYLNRFLFKVARLGILNYLRIKR